jgi:hypothetical protein
VGKFFGDHQVVAGTTPHSLVPTAPFRGNRTLLFPGILEPQPPGKDGALGPELGPWGVREWRSVDGGQERMMEEWGTIQCLSGKEVWGQACVTSATQPKERKRRE